MKRTRVTRELQFLALFFILPMAALISIDLSLSNAPPPVAARYVVGRHMLVPDLHHRRVDLYLTPLTRLIPQPAFPLLLSC